MEKEKGSYHCGGKGPWVAARIGRGIAIAVLLALVFGLFVMMLWNWLAPAVFSLREISYSQAVGLIILARILFGIRGMRPHFGHAMHGHGRWSWGGPCAGEGGPVNGSIKDWHHYDAWWEEEGREAFKRYIEKQGR